MRWIVKKIDKIIISVLTLVVMKFATQGFLQNKFENFVNKNAEKVEKVIGNNKTNLKSFKIVKIYDGDTITVLNENGEKQKIRFYGIDAPEKTQDDGIKALKILNNVISVDDTVKVDIVSKDRYGRLVGKIYKDDIYVNLYMLKNGGAWYYEEYAPNEIEFKKAFENAKENKIGIFSNNKIIKPGDYRKQQNKRK